MPVCPSPFDCLAPISIHTVKTGTPLSRRHNCLSSMSYLLSSQKFSFILLADAQACHYITGTNSCLCRVNHMNITQSIFSPSHLVLAHFLCNEVCSHKKVKQNNNNKKRYGVYFDLELRKHVI